MLLSLHRWVAEPRPLLQGCSLTTPATVRGHLYTPFLVLEVLEGHVAAVFEMTTMVISVETLPWGVVTIHCHTPESSSVRCFSIRVWIMVDLSGVSSVMTKIPTLRLVDTTSPRRNHTMRVSLLMIEARQIKGILSPSNTTWLLFGRISNSGNSRGRSKKNKNHQWSTNVMQLKSYMLF